MHRDFRDRLSIDDELLALVLLAPGWNDRTHRRLMTASAHPYIEIMICNGGQTKDLHAWSEYYPITQALAKQLKDTGCVEGRKDWGFTDHHECTLTAIGQRLLDEKRAQFMEDVQTFLLREHPDIPRSVEVMSGSNAHTLTIMRWLRALDDFFVAMEINEQRDQVRRTRGTLRLLLADEWQR